MPTKTLKDRIQFILEGGSVVRFHARPGLLQQTDAAHSWGVAVLVYLLSPVQPSVELLMAALTHDLAEQFMGDVPAPAKWALGAQEAYARLENEKLQRYGLNFCGLLSANEARLLKLADTMDGMLHCCKEAALGNRTVHLMYGKWYALAQDIVAAAECELLIAINQIWEESNGSQGPKFDVYAAD
jgi:5'-deoxynucleotidase YfbR-like HD superfamily hydrolase